MTVFFDIETNGLLDDLTKVVCMSYSIDGGEPVTVSDPHGIIDAISMIESADFVCGHNVLSFDFMALEKVFGPIKLSGQVIDTLVMARLAYPEIHLIDQHPKTGANQLHPVPPHLSGSHSLKSWGYRLGIHKDSYIESVADFSNLKFSKELAEYCEQDVRVTVRLLKHLESRSVDETARLLEHGFAACIANQMANGFGFDVQAAASLYADLVAERDAIVADLQAEIPPTEVKLKTKTKYIPFNPGSRQQIAVVLKDRCGWEPSEFTPTGEPKVDESSLEKIDHPLAKKFIRYLMLSKRIGMLAEGNEAWLKAEKKGRIYGYVNHNGAVTGRCTHRSPNMAQVPASHSPYGKECRSLFVAPPGKLLVGVDAAGLELRCLAHYMSAYDDGFYVSEILNGDIHTTNQKAAGLETRDQAKLFIYAFLYGAGPAKLGSIVGGGPDAGKKLKSRFLKKIPGLKKLQDDISLAIERKGHLNGLDGRILLVRSSHSALNTLLQSAGAVIMKAATVLMNDSLIANGIDFLQVAHIHDEVQFEVAEDQAHRAAELVEDAIVEAGRVLKVRCPLSGNSRVGRSWAETH